MEKQDVSIIFLFSFKYANTEIMSNICVISEQPELSELLQQHPVIPDVEVRFVAYGQPVPEVVSVFLVQLDAEDTEGWLAAYTGTAPVLALLPKKAESRFWLLRERWLEEKGVEVEWCILPARLPQLIERIRFYLKRSVKQAKSHLLLLNSDYRLDVGGHSLYSNDGHIVLTEKETSLLEFLHRHAPNPVPREKLLHAIWGYGEHIDTHTLETHIYRLRQKIGHASPLIVTTEEGYGLVV